jgi:hypothetical protein
MMLGGFRNFMKIHHLRSRKAVTSMQQVYTPQQKLFLMSQSNALQEKQQRRRYNFASQEYARCFDTSADGNGEIIVDVGHIRQEAVSYLERTFDDMLWYKDPIASIVCGKKLQNGTLSNTIDAFGRVNGQIMYANTMEVDILRHHIMTYQSPYTDLREKLGKIEHELLTTHVGFLIGNQAADFSKQDGVTEIEESIQANIVERRMNGKAEKRLVTEVRVLLNEFISLTFSGGGNEFSCECRSFDF